MSTAFSSTDPLLTISMTFQKSGTSKRKNVVIEKIVGSERVDKLIAQLFSEVYI